MRNLVSMDLYRAKRSKSLYVCLGVLLLFTAMTLGMVWLMGTRQGQEIAVRIGMLVAADMGEASSILDGIDTLQMFRQIGMDGGGYNLVFGIWVMLFVCADYQSGFIKNVMAVHQNRWNYIGSKILTAGIMNFFYIGIQFLFMLLLNRLFGNLVPYAGWGDTVFYLSWAWVLTTAFSMLIILVCVLFRNVTAGSLAAVFFGGGMLVMPLYSVLQQFHLGGWLEYSIYMTMNFGASQYTSLSDLRVYVIGAGYLLLYGIVAGIVFKKQDI